MAVLVVAVLPAWTAVAVGYVVDGYRRRSGPRLRFGLGLAVVAVAQLYRAATGAPIGDPVFAALRLVGAVIVLVALARLVARSLAVVRSQQFAQQEELTVAALHLERAQELAAERDHELRNGLAGLAGITHLLSSGADDEEQQRLKLAVLSELTRLHTILDGRGLAFEAPDGAAARRVRRRTGARRAGHAAPVGGRADHGGRRRRRCARAATPRCSPRWSPTCSPTATGTRRGRRSPSAGTGRGTGSSSRSATRGPACGRRSGTTCCSAASTIPAAGGSGLGCTSAPS